MHTIILPGMQEKNEEFKNKDIKKAISEISNAKEKEIVGLSEERIDLCQAGSLFRGSNILIFALLIFESLFTHHFLAHFGSPYSYGGIDFS